MNAGIGSLPARRHCFDYIQKMHDKYLSSKIDTAKDIENIVLVNKQVVDGIDYLF